MIACLIYYSGTTCWSKTGATSILRKDRGGRRNRTIERKFEKRLHFGFCILGPPAGAKQELAVYGERGEQ